MTSMNYQIATLIWILLIIAVIISGLVSAGLMINQLDAYRPDFRKVWLGVAGIFVTAIIGWGIWVIYPLTAAAIS